MSWLTGFQRSDFLMVRTAFLFFRIGFWLAGA
jgi:hypothetical protein